MFRMKLVVLAKQYGCFTASLAVDIARTKRFQRLNFFLGSYWEFIYFIGNKN